MGDLKEQEMDSALVSQKKHGPAEFEHLTLPGSPLCFLSATRGAAFARWMSVD